MKTKTYLLFIFILVLITSCQMVDRFKGDEAIKLVQSKKFGAMNAYLLNLAFFSKKHDFNTLSLLSINADPTNLEMANNMAECFSSDHFAWNATYTENKTFLVSFTNLTKNVGLVWEADNENQIVRCVTFDTELAKKYHIKKQ